MSGRWWILCLALLVTVAGCGWMTSKKLEGRWQFAPAQQAETSTSHDQGAASNEMPLVQGFGARLQMELEFRSDGTVTLSMGDNPTLQLWSRRWKVVGTEGDRVTIELSGLDGSRPTPTQITFVDYDHFAFSPPGMGNRVLTFTRLKQP